MPPRRAEQLAQDSGQALVEYALILAAASVGIMVALLILRNSIGTTVEATGNRDKLDALIKVLEPFGIKELVQSGMVAIGRGGRSITDRALRPVERSA